MDAHADPNQKAEKDERFNGTDGKRGVTSRDTYEDTSNQCGFYRDFGTKLERKYSMIIHSLLIRNSAKKISCMSKNHLFRETSP